MIAQKEVFIPTVGTVSTENYEFPNSTKDWSLQTVFSVGAGAGCELTILVSNLPNDGYVPYSPMVKDMDMTNDDNLIIYDNIMPARYMKLDYVAGATTGTLSFVIIK
jgi:hypothetical protein